MSETNADLPQAETEADGLPQPNPRYVKTLLIVCIGLGVLLVVGAAVVVGTVIKRVNNPESVPQKPGFGTSEIAIPFGAQLVDIENGDSRIIVKLKHRDGPLMILLDPRNGKEKGRIRLRAGPDVD